MRSRTYNPQYRGQERTVAIVILLPTRLQDTVSPSSKTPKSTNTFVLLSAVVHPAAETVMIKQVSVVLRYVFLVFSAGIEKSAILLQQDSADAIRNVIPFLEISLFHRVTSFLGVVVECARTG